MKITHIVFSLNTGGMETMLIDILNQQSKYNEVSLIIINKSYNNDLIRKINNSVKIFLINRKPKSYSILKLFKLNKTLFFLKPDVVHVHNFEIVRIIIKNYFIILTIHAVNLNLKYLHKYNKLVSISGAVQKDLYQRFKTESIIISNGIQLNEILIKKSYDLKVFRIIQVGRLDHELKGQHILVKAISKLHNENGIKNLQVTIVGEGKSEKFLNMMIQKYELESIIKLVGLKSRDILYKNLKDYELLVQPSFFEGFGLTVVEAMAAKIPVLVSDIGGPREILNGGNYGFVFKKGDPKDLADKIIEIIELYKTDEIKRIVEFAHKHVSINYSIENTVDKYLKLYSQINKE